MSQVYSFSANSMITIMTEAQLIDLTEERRARGCSKAELDLWRNWHLVQLQGNLH